MDMNFLDLCREVISFDCSPPSGTRALGDFLAGVCKDMGFAVDTQEEILHGVPQTNLIVRPPQQKLPIQDELLLLTHLDTSDPGISSAWTKTQQNPFQMSIYRDELYGLGVANTKLDFLCKLFAVKEFLTEEFKKNIAIVGTYGEQLGMDGAVKLLRRKKIQPKYALVGGATQLKICSSGVGLVVVEIEIPFSAEEKNYQKQHDMSESSSTRSKIFHGQAAHSSRPQDGDNAIIKMLNYLADLPDNVVIMDIDGGISYNSVPATAILEIDVVGALSNTVNSKLKSLLQTLQNLEGKLEKIKDPAFTPPHSTLNLGQIRKTEGSIHLLGSCRILPYIQEVTYQSWMSELEEACQDLGAKFEYKTYKHPFHLNSMETQSPQKTNRDFLSTALKVHKKTLQTDLPEGTTSLCTEASVLSRFGIECLVFGAGESKKNIHAPNEKISIKDLEKAIDFYKQFIREWCL